MPNPFTALPPKVRKALYSLYAFAGFVLGGIVLVAQPDWTDTAFKVMGYIGPFLGVTAASNVSTSTPDDPGADQP